MLGVVAVRLASDVIALRIEAHPFPLPLSRDTHVDDLGRFDKIDGGRLLLSPHRLPSPILCASAVPLGRKCHRILLADDDIGRLQEIEHCQAHLATGGGS